MSDNLLYHVHTLRTAFMSKYYLQPNTIGIDEYKQLITHPQFFIATSDITFLCKNIFSCSIYNGVNK